MSRIFIGAGPSLSARKRPSYRRGSADAEVFPIRLCRPKIGSRSHLLASTSKDSIREGRELRVMQILVTGASGMLGSHLLKELAGHGHHVTAWSGSTGGSRSGYALRNVNLADPAALRAAIDEANPDVIIHAAAVSSAASVLRDVRHAWNVNVRGTQVLAEWTAQNR